MWDLATGAELQRLEGHSDYVRSVAFSPDGARLASGSQDKSVPALPQPPSKTAKRRTRACAERQVALKALQPRQRGGGVWV